VVFTHQKCSGQTSRSGKFRYSVSCKHCWGLLGNSNCLHLVMVGVMSKFSGFKVTPLPCVLASVFVYLDNWQLYRAQATKEDIHKPCVKSVLSSLSSYSSTTNTWALICCLAVYESLNQMAGQLLLLQVQKRQHHWNQG